MWGRYPAFGNRESSSVARGRPRGRAATNVAESAGLVEAVEPETWLGPLAISNGRGIGGMGVLEGKVAIVTGGTSGIGARTVELFAEEGARVVIAARRREEGEALAGRLGAAVSFIQTDVTREPQVQAMIGHAIARFGRLDCLFNNAGSGPRASGIADLDMDAFDAAIAVNLRAAVLGMKHAAPIMRDQGSGSVINTASLAGLRSGYSSHPYSAAKAALIHLTRCVAVELGPRNVRVNSISPGGIVTGIFGKGGGMPHALAEQSLDGLKDYFATVQPIPRAGLPDDIARAAVFLASDASSFVNGHDLVVDGGIAAGQDWSGFQTLRSEIGRHISG
jgi:NAD(P)-dependent dehydrogenase (short-subunit alcohol dehydrogenase family)